jgi:hypothetical protein
VVYGFRAGGHLTTGFFSQRVTPSRRILDKSGHIILHCDLDYSFVAVWAGTEIAGAVLPLQPLSLHITLGWDHAHYLSLARDDVGHGDHYRTLH